MNQLQRDCLLDVAQKLESGEIPAELFNIEKWGNLDQICELQEAEDKEAATKEMLKNCGTAGCVGGWLIALHGDRLQLKLVNYSCLGSEGYYNFPGILRADEGPPPVQDDPDYSYIYHHSLAMLQQQLGLSEKSTTHIFDCDNYENTEDDLRDEAARRISEVLETEPVTAEET